MKTKSTISQIQTFITKPYWFYGLILVLIVLGGYLLFYDMNFGPWAFSDSAEYIISAKNLVEGYGLGVHAPNGAFMPLTLHPPFYSLLLAPFLFLNLEIFITIKWLNILFFTGSLFLVAYGIFRISQSTLWALTVAIIFLVSPALLDNFTSAMSEPLFIFLSIANFIFLNLYIKEKKKWYFWVAIVSASLATLTRYIGLTSIFTGVILLLLFFEGSWKKRIGISLIYAIVAFIPVIIWFVYVGILSGSMAARTFDLNKSIFEAINVNRFAFTEVAAEWLPFRTVWFSSWKSKVITIYATFLLSSSLLVLLLVTRWKKRIDWRYSKTLILGAGIFLVGYFGFLIVSYFSSLPPDLNQRMFSPLIIFIFLFIFGVLFTSIQAYKLSKILYLIPVVLFLIVSISYWQQTRSIALDRHTVEFSYSSPTWKNSNIISEIKNTSRKTTLYSNHPVGILLHTGLFPYEISDLQQAIADTTKNQLITMALFNPISDEDQLIIDNYLSSEANKKFDLVATKDFPDGIIYQFAANE